MAMVDLIYFLNFMTHLKQKMQVILGQISEISFRHLKINETFKLKLNEQ